MTFETRRFNAEFTSRAVSSPAVEEVIGLKRLFSTLLYEEFRQLLICSGNFGFLTRVLGQQEYNVNNTMETSTAGRSTLLSSLY